MAVMLGIGGVAGGPKPTASPRFEDYPAREAFAGRPVAPQIITVSQRRYGTIIRQGVEKGWGVRVDGIEQNKPGPNFAGDMIFIQWGCGAPCMMAALVNAQTGEVFPPPLAREDTLELPLLNIGGYSAGRNPELQFRNNSLLMVVSATPNWFKPHARSYRHYFVWELHRWVLVFKEPLD